MNGIDQLFNCNNSKRIKVYLATETTADPYEKNKTYSLLPPITIRGLVTDLIASQISWKLPGINTSKAKEIWVEKRHRSLLEQSYKIVIESEDYVGWKQNGQMQIREIDQSLRIYIYKDSVSS